MSTAITSIDGAARSGSRNSGSYESLVQSFEASAATKSSKENAKTQLAAAKSKIPPTNDVSPGAKSTKSEKATANVLRVHAEHEGATILQSIQNLADGQSANPKPESPSGQVRKAAHNLSALMQRSNTNILNLVILAADQAIQDIPDPNFSAIGASVSGCANPTRPSKSQK